MILITIDGLPVPWKSPYVHRKGAFNPRFREKEYYQWQIKAQFNQTPLTVPVSLDITFHMPVPAGTSKIRRTQMLNGVLHHFKRPDLSNCIKFLEDTLKTIVFEDDSQVFQINARKIYGEHPKTVVQISPV